MISFLDKKIFSSFFELNSYVSHLKDHSSYLKKSSIYFAQFYPEDE